MIKKLGHILWVHPVSTVVNAIYLWVGTLVTIAAKVWAPYTWDGLWAALGILVAVCLPITLVDYVGTILWDRHDAKKKQEKKWTK